MGANIVNLNINPCKMCMPMGAASALCGIKGCMSILHGSQGCATYIRRHMATHYNEPVDIASSSLTEEGTVFGGQENLKKGINNLIKLYNPEIIGIATTCLAETIGEDVEAIVKNFYAENPDTKVKIINVSSAGYGGTQYEGFFKALRAVVEQTQQDSTPTGKINIVTPMISPADTRWIKEFLEEMGVDYILLPDLSENLDGVSQEKYERLKSGGTDIEDIAKMAGSKITIELSEFVKDEDSVAKYLYDSFAVPYIRLPLPTGIRAMDSFIDAIKNNGGSVTKKIVKERGRYLDAMVDSHKYCAEARVSVFGEPDFVLAVTGLCTENGAVPVVATTGSVCNSFKKKLEPEISEVSKRMFVEKTVITDDCDFEAIEEFSKELGANIMIGNSDGRRISHKLGIDLIRCGFPIHDHLGGQRIRMLGFEGSLNILDGIANSILENKEKNFRTKIYDSFFKASKEKKNEEENMKTIEEKTKSHPCFNCGANKNARIHLPVAPKCNIQCNYCVRKYDCPNESRPGVTTEVLSPQKAFEKYVAVKEKMPNLTVVGIAGPGDALANWDKTKETLSLIREYDPDVTFCLSTNGLMLPLYAQELIDLGVSHVTVTMNAVDTKIGAEIYNHVNYMGIRFTGEAAAAILLANQLSGLKYLASRGIICKVNCVALKGINDGHIYEVTKKVKEIGVYITNIMPHIPVEGSCFEDLDRLNNKEINELREKCEVNIKQMRHCRQCRADAIGTLDNDLSIEYRGCSQKSADDELSLPQAKFAVATKSGMLVDQHFGHADEFYIYESNGKDAKFIEKRTVSKYCTGSENCDDKKSKIDTILNAVSDCNGVLALRIGESPSQKLKDSGIEVISTYDRIEDAVKTAALNIIKKG